MKKFKVFAVALMVSTTLVGSDVMAQTQRGRAAGTTGTTSSSASRAPSAPSGSTSASRPSTGPSTGSTPQRPGGTTAPGSNNNSKPGGNVGTPPTGGNNSSANRPGGSNNPGGNVSQRPSTPNTKPNNPTPPPPSTNRPNNPTPPPPPGNQPPRPNTNTRPPRPYTPPTYTYYRPTRPTNWYATYNTPYFNSVLNGAFLLGASWASTLNNIQTRYNYGGYYNNEVYLSNVSYCNVNWPNVTLYYSNSYPYGYLEGCMYSASSISYDTSRYNYVYNYLTNMYGFPYGTQNLTGGGMSCTWWGTNNTYMTLSFYPEYVPGVGTRYFTTLVTGN